MHQASLFITALKDSFVFKWQVLKFQYGEWLVTQILSEGELQSS